MLKKIIFIFSTIFLITACFSTNEAEQAVDHAWKCNIAKMEKDWVAFDAYCPPGESKSLSSASLTNIDVFSCQKKIVDFLEGAIKEIKVSNVMDRCLEILFLSEVTNISMEDFTSKCNKDNVIKYPEVENVCELYKLNYSLEEWEFNQNFCNKYSNKIYDVRRKTIYPNFNEKFLTFCNKSPT